MFFAGTCYKAANWVYIGNTTGRGKTENSDKSVSDNNPDTKSGDASENKPEDTETNVCEQALKRAILHRKNSMFYKNMHGAYIGDIFMSLIHTCNIMNINPFKYLVAIQKYSSEVLVKDH